MADPKNKGVSARDELPLGAARTGVMSDRVRATLEQFERGALELPEENDRFHIDPSKIPDGTTYEWKRASVFGKEDSTYFATMERGGWSAVEASRHPEYARNNNNGYIELDGMVLMERPDVITRHVRQRERRNAMEAVAVKEQEAMLTPSGTLPRDAPELKNANIGIRRNFEPVSTGDMIPND